MITHVDVFGKKVEVRITGQGKLSKQSQLVVAAKSGHSIEVDRPDILIEEIKKLHNL